MSKLEKIVAIGEQNVTVQVEISEKYIYINYLPPLIFLEQLSHDGEIIENNPLHLQLINTLIKDDTELSKDSRLTITPDYRVQLARAISCLWA